MAGNKSFSKDIVNKLKVKVQGDSKKEAKAEEEANKLNPLNELDPSNGLDFGVIDYGSCAYLKPCCKRLPAPCGCLAYLALAITFVGGMVTSIIIW